jgi:hypothetical protein
MKNHVVIKELLKRGVTPTPTPIGMQVHGFYKAGIIELHRSEDPEVLICKNRYGDLHEIRTFDDLVLIHFAWWLKSRVRAEFWGQPDQSWINDYLRLDLIEVKTMVVYSPKNQ